MSIVTTHAGPVTIISPQGRLDSNTAKAFEADLLAQVSSGTLSLVINFAELDYISSAGLRVILMAAKRVKSAKGAFALAGMAEHIREVFQVSGFLSILDAFPDVAQATAAMTK